MMGVTVAEEKVNDAHAWCVETFDHDNDLRWYVDYQPLLVPEFVFQRDDDAALFMLRWL